MSATAATYIECDQCGAFCMPRHRRKKALKLAAERGWDIGKGDIADLCPLCVAAPLAVAAASETREAGGQE